MLRICILLRLHEDHPAFTFDHQVKAAGLLGHLQLVPIPVELEPEWRHDSVAILILSAVLDTPQWLKSAPRNVVRWHYVNVYKMDTLSTLMCILQYKHYLSSNLT